MYHNIFIHSSVNGHLSYFHVLAIINSTAVNVGVHVSFCMTVFCNIGPGVRIRMLGLAVLKFFLLAYGGCPLQGLLPMSIPMGLVWGFHHHLALFPHFLFADS